VVWVAAKGELHRKRNFGNGDEVAQGSGSSVFCVCSSEERFTSSDAKEARKP